METVIYCSIVSSLLMFFFTSSAARHLCVWYIEHVSTQQERLPSSDDYYRYVVFKNFFR